MIGVMINGSIGYAANSYTQAYKKGMKAYKAKKADKVKEHFTEAMKYATMGEEKSNLQWYIGYTYYIKKDYETARAELAKVLEKARITPGEITELVTEMFQAYQEFRIAII